MYAYSWYLDFMSPGWDALIAGDYEMLMPLTWRRKFGIDYLYQPAFTAQLGVFGNDINIQLLGEAFKVIRHRYRLVEISLNEGNQMHPSEDVTLSTNYVLHLDAPVSVLRTNFRDATLRRIVQSKEAGNHFIHDVPVEQVLALMLSKMSRVSNVGRHDADRFEKLFQFAAPKGLAKTFGVVGPDGTLLSSTVMLEADNRAYYLMAGNDPRGRASFASHLLIDGLIDYYAERVSIFDFEGSDIPGVAMFYENFGARAVQYPKWRINRLPRLVNWLKSLS